MCGRFAITLPDEAMAQLFDALPGNDLPEVPRYNVCPTTQVATVVSGEGARRLRPMRWGFIPHWYKSPADGPLLINARAETIAEKPAFRAACRERRCIVPASGFYEWTKDAEGNRLPWYITRTDGAPMGFAAIWQDWSREGEDKVDGPTCAIVTCAATHEMAGIHHRSPVILEPDDWAKWLGEEGKGAATLMQPPAQGVVRMWRVDPAVNSNRASGAALVQPVGA
ncbi:SOS response-associated peptidase [Vannielia litorea]|uniref:Abasic site processing protein n=1 Tax=Vannielia litorea TaxID=1217970 RepID=A0A1N6IKZ5_9RHOB|nr:SOS response-associated peptidase [Vannielia litorea]SIO32667.1 Putative SOS response-associated peptidase YedK [Vannielia litorea]